MSEEILKEPRKSVSNEDFFLELFKNIDSIDPNGLTGEILLGWGYKKIQPQHQVLDVAPDLLKQLLILGTDYNDKAIKIPQKYLDGKMSKKGEVLLDNARKLIKYPLYANMISSMVAIIVLEHVKEKITKKAVIELMVGEDGQFLIANTNKEPASNDSKPEKNRGEEVNCIPSMPGLKRADH